MSKKLEIFLLEDSPSRCREFAENFLAWGQPHYLDQTDTVEDAKQILTQRDFDLVLLDHDLHFDHYDPGASSDIPSGSDMALWLAENPDIAKRHKHYIVHSLNDQGRMFMVETLRGIGVSVDPFPFLWKSDEIWKTFGLCDQLLEKKGGKTNGA